MSEYEEFFKNMKPLLQKKDKRGYTIVEVGIFDRIDNKMHRELIFSKRYKIEPYKKREKAYYEEAIKETAQELDLPYDKTKFVIDHHMLATKFIIQNHIYSIISIDFGGYYKMKKSPVLVGIYTLIWHMLHIAGIEKPDEQFYHILKTASALCSNRMYRGFVKVFGRYNKNITNDTSFSSNSTTEGQKYAILAHSLERSYYKKFVQKLDKKFFNSEFFVYYKGDCIHDYPEHTQESFKEQMALNKKRSVFIIDWFLVCSKAFYLIKRTRKMDTYYEMYCGGLTKKEYFDLLEQEREPNFIVTLSEQRYEQWDYYFNLHLIITDILLKGNHVRYQKPLDLYHRVYYNGQTTEDTLKLKFVPYNFYKTKK
ncbi:MAG: hypothetical protein D6717_00550 [Gammaproteobacteria bacterium]|nr:MAG: hypothetical protein D6717_00550 [Gammaproteobacteria bacterium]